MTDSRRSLADIWHAYPSDSETFGTICSRIHVWRIGLDSIVGPVGDNLSANELARAERFSRMEDRRRFVAARSILRVILADVLERGDEAGKGAALRFGYGPAGKPFLLDDPQLHFNVSHSEDIAVIAVTRVGEVGIDIEKQRDMVDLDNVARLVFNDAEKTAVLGCSPGERESVFYRIWTRKEALLKAMGLGLPALTYPDDASLSHAGNAWLVTSLPHLDGYASALARPRHAHGLRLWSWPTAAACAASNDAPGRQMLPALATSS